MDIRYPIKIYITKNSGKTEKVLILDPACAASLINLNSQTVSFLPNPWSHIKLRRRKAVLCISNKGSIQPYIHGCLYPLERKNYPLSWKRLLQIKFPDIASHRIVIPVYFGWTQFRMSVPWIHRINILTFIISLKLNMPRHLNLIKASIVKVFLIKFCPSKGWIFCIGKLPYSV